jgi:hypothetical protein
MFNFRSILNKFAPGRDADEGKSPRMIEQRLTGRYINRKVLDRIINEMKCGLSESAGKAVEYEVRT